MIGNYYYGACDGFHFSDNYVTGDNIYLRELQNFFFEVLGMMSITHYGAIGDGRTDNYGPIQVAIDDAIRRGLSYIYVPYGRFIYAGNLVNLDKVEFVGNPHAKILNIRTGEEIPIKQFGVGTTTTNYEDLSNKPQINSIELDGNVSLTDIGVQEKLVAGSNITIEGNVISSTGGGGGGVSGAITAYLASNVTLADADYVVELTQLSKMGNNLTLDTANDCIVVGSDVSFLRVSAIVDYSSNSSSTFKTINIRKNGTKYCQVRQGKYSDADYTGVVPSILIPVTENDTIDLKVNFAVGDKIYGATTVGGVTYPYTYITVEAIG